MPRHDFDDCVRISERVSWTVADVIGDRRPDLARPFLPESLACVENLTCLSPAEKLSLNQVRGHSYAYLFCFIEESILRGVQHHLRFTKPGEMDRMRALLRFLDEEVKHQQMFTAFCKAYRALVGVPCGVLEQRVTADDVAMTLTANSPLAVLLTVLHIEWVSQLHFVESCGGDAQHRLDPLFRSLLKAHWLEEAQHTKVDLLLIDRLVEKASAADIDRAIDEYVQIGGAIDGLLYQQVELDVASLERVIGRTLDSADRDEVLLSQSIACRRSLLWMGMTNPDFVEVLTRLSPSGARKVEEAAGSMVA